MDCMAVMKALVRTGAMLFDIYGGMQRGRPDDARAPVFIGLAVTSIICLLAPWRRTLTLRLGIGFPVRKEYIIHMVIKY